MNIHWVLDDFDFIRRDVKVVLSALLRGCDLLRAQIDLFVLYRLLASNLKVCDEDVRFDFCWVLIDYWLIRLS